MKKILIYTILLSVVFCISDLKASDWRKLVDLGGNWSFTVGDNPDWAKQDVNTSSWDQLPVPSDWEKFYQGYNGYAWYRKTFNIGPEYDMKGLQLFLGIIDDVDEVFLNGIKIGQTGDFPPNYKTAYEIERQYLIPQKLLKEKDNTIAIRVFDEMRNGGILYGDKIGIFYDYDINFLDLNLEGMWKFSSEWDYGYHLEDFDDSNWKKIYVPAKWEAQGYQLLDGKAVYRKTFEAPKSLNNGEDLYLMLGKIDDNDKVYLNGKLIGETEDLPNYSYFNRNNNYLLQRIYKIPSEVMKSKNVICVEVYDRFGFGGIYEGPIGISSEDKAELFKRKVKIEDDKDENPIKEFFKFIFE